MNASNVLISGMKGLGIEIGAPRAPPATRSHPAAKNVALGGVKSLTIHDPEPVALRDLSSQFFLRAEDVGKNRAAATLPRLAELNSYVPIQVHHGPLAPSVVAGFQVCAARATQQPVTAL